MDLPVIGAHCALPSCNELDLLPIQCLCDNMYCRKHIFPDSHDCTSLVTIDQDVQSRNKDRSGRCSFTKCNRQNLSSFGSTSNNIGNSAECTGCAFSFCAVHRFPSAHSCPGVADGQPSDRTDTARELLLKNFSASKTVPSVQKPRILTTKDPKKLAQIQKVELMKMRQKAQPGDPKTGSSSIPIPERHYILAKSDAENDSFRPFWFIKSISMGRAFDLLQDRLGIVNTSGSKCSLFKLSLDETEHEKVTTFDTTVSQALETGSKVIIMKDIES